MRIVSLICLIACQSCTEIPSDSNLEPLYEVINQSFIQCKIVIDLLPIVMIPDNIISDNKPSLPPKDVAMLAVSTIDEMLDMGYINKVDAKSFKSIARNSQSIIQLEKLRIIAPSISRHSVYAAFDSKPGEEAFKEIGCFMNFSKSMMCQDGSLVLIYAENYRSYWNSEGNWILYSRDGEKWKEIFRKLV